MNYNFQVHNTVASLRRRALEGADGIVLECLAVHYHGVAFHNMFLYKVVVRLVDDEVQRNGRVAAVRSQQVLLVDTALGEFFTIEEVEITFADSRYNCAVLNR